MCFRGRNGVTKSQIHRYGATSMESRTAPVCTVHTPRRVVGDSTLVIYGNGHTV